jgi:tripartite-type tricarboxylate transporter receptor subunit TctC
MLTRRRLIALSAALAAAPSHFAGAARAQAPAGFPNKPVHVIVPVAAGGPTDVVARMLGDKAFEDVGPAGRRREQGRRRHQHRQ